MSEFFLELFSEEIPPSLQKNLREDLLDKFNKLFMKKFISFNKSFSYSTPNRSIIVFEGIKKKVVLKPDEIRGPNINAPEVALEGFMRSNKISKDDLFTKKIDKGDFYFFKTKSKTLKTHDLLEQLAPVLLKKIQWKKSMRWGDYDLNWGRPLKTIIALFNNKIVNFGFHHLKSGNQTITGVGNEEKLRKINNFKFYLKVLDAQNTVLDQLTN